MADCAKKVLAKQTHRIGNCYLKVKPAELRHQPLHIFTALNDDCLREVFGYLDLMDLMNAAQVCVRFNQQAKETFAAKYKVCNLDFDSMKYKRITIHQADDMLRLFGEMIHTLKVDQFFIETEIPILRIASRYCTALKELELTNFTWFPNLKKIRPIFKHLEKLHLNHCKFSNTLRNLSNVCMELKSLRLNGCDMLSCKGIINQFVKLEDAQFNECIDLDGCAVESFIEMNSNLIKFSMTQNGEWMSTRHIHSIGQNLNHLLELEIDEEIYYMDKQIMQNLSQLDKLKVLKLNFNELAVTPLLKSFVEKEVPIEYLKLINGAIDSETIDYISKMKGVKTLELIQSDGEITDEHLIQLTKELPQLSELYVKDPPTDITTIGLKKMLPHANKLSLLHLESVHSISIDVDDYKAMLETVKRRPEKVKLLIKIKCDGDKVKVDDLVLAENRDIIFIDETIEDESSIDTDYELDYSDDTFGNGYSDDDFWYDHDSDADSENGFGVGFMNGRMFFIG